MPNGEIAAPHETNFKPIDMLLEVVVIPVSDVDRAKKFYGMLGWRLDADVSTGPDSRLIQFTPPGSPCSIQFGTNLFGKDVPAAVPGQIQGTYLIVSDISAARDQLIALGVEVSEVFHCSSGYACRFPGNDGRVNGPHPQRGSYGSFASFCDPDGNSWLLQEITTRLPGRVGGSTTYASTEDLLQALKRAAAAHGQHELKTGSDPNWPEWYANYMVSEYSGEKLPE